MPSSLTQIPRRSDSRNPLSMSRRAELKALNALELGRLMVASVASTHADRLAWVSVYPIDSHKSRDLLGRSGRSDLVGTSPVYRIRKFEVAKVLIEKDVWVAESDLQNGEDVFVRGVDALEKALEQFGSSVASLVPPFRSDYPI